VAVLDGIRVVVTGSATAVDMASLLLSDNGAEVIRVEPPGGDARRRLPAWRLWNRGAHSIVLDAAVTADRIAIDALVDTADVLLEVQGGAAGLGWSFSYDVLAARNPGLVHCTVTAFGRSGELSGLPPYDGVVEARSGANVDLGTTLERGAPAYRARPNPSYATANIVVQSVAAALLVRSRDGRGQHVDTSLYQGLLAYDYSSALRRQDELGELDPPLPAAARRAGPFLPYLVCRCQDGQWMQITNNTARLFRHWMDVIGLGYIWDDPRFKGAPSAIPDLADKVELAHLILDRMAARTFDEWLAIFLREGLTGDHFQTTQQAMDHPQVIHNGSVVAVQDPEVGPTLQLGPTIGFSDSPAVTPAAAPALDADRAAVLGTRRADGTPRASSAGAGGAGGAAGRGPLAGMLVLDFATWLAGPFGTSLLADMGARVIKIESPAGDDARHGLGGRARTFQGKESLAIDLKSEEGRAAVRRLLARADAVMHNMRGDAAARLGVDYQTAKELNPDVVYLYAGSYGSTGPGAGRAAFHPMMGALSGGALRQLGRGNEPPAADVPLDAEARYAYSLRMLRANEASPDITGALGVATALSLGLLHRERTGRGQYIETTMLASNLLLCSEDAIRYAGQPALPELDSELRGTGALNRLYRTADGWLFLCTPTEPEWQQLGTALGHTEWAGDPRYQTAETRRRFNDQLVAEVATALESRSAAEWEGLLARAGVAGVRADASTGDDFFLSHPQSVGNGFVVRDSFPGMSSYRRAGTASTLSLTPGVAKIAHPFGQDGPDILAELGFDGPAIQAMIDGGVLVSTAMPSGPAQLKEICRGPNRRAGPWRSSPGHCGANGFRELITGTGNFISGADACLPAAPQPAASSCTRRSCGVPPSFRFQLVPPAGDRALSRGQRNIWPHPDVADHASFRELQIFI
jgi:crotonobetainyl-CoA:carnitine CoA-transferase CaiB-like acyl-CoA transferase